MSDRKWVEGDRVECYQESECLVATVVRDSDGVVLRVSDSLVVAGSQKNLSRLGWHLQNAGYNPDRRANPHQ